MSKLNLNDINFLTYLFFIFSNSVVNFGTITNLTFKEKQEVEYIEPYTQPPRDDHSHELMLKSIPEPLRVSSTTPQPPIRQLEEIEAVTENKSESLDIE